MIVLRALASAMIALGGSAAGSAAPAAGQPGGASAQTPADPGGSALRDVVALARSGRFGDPASIEALLQLPGLAAALVRTAPRAGDITRPATFDAPGNSAIRTVVAHSGSASPGGNSATIVFKDGYCPSIHGIEEAFGASLSVASIRRLHGGGSFPYYHLEFRAADGRDVHVGLGVCAIHLMPAPARR